MASRNFKNKSSGSNLGRRGKNTFTTKSGQTIKINRSLVGRVQAYRASSAQKRAERLVGMPKGRLQRVLHRLKPANLYKYWFSREGGIMALKVLGIGILSSFILLVAVFAFFRKDLPDLNENFGKNLGGSIQYYDKTGQVLLWEDFDAVKRIPVAPKDMSDNIKRATVAIEDKDFYKHGGFDVRAIARAGVNNAFGRNSTQGGSTITQQLVKLSQNWTDKRTYSRKVKELILSVELERTYNKDEILSGYLNVAPYGNIEYGVEAASNDYFHKSAKDLTIEEAAFLAAIPKSPSVYSPYGPYFDKGQLVGRQLYIIDQMVDQGMIKKDEAEAAKKIDVLAKVKPQQAKYANIKAPYFSLAAKSEVDTLFGQTSAKRGGWKVITTLDMKLQEIAEKAVADNVANINRYGANEAAMVAEDVKTGQIVALVGGVDFNNEEHGKINYAHNAFIPPGSTFKPFDYAALIENSENAGAGSVLYDSTVPLPGYPCTKKGRGGNCLVNYDFREPGPVTLRYALGGSRNIPAVKAQLIAGTDKTIDMANKMMANPTNPNAYQCYSDEALTITAPCYGASAIGDGAFLHLDDHVNGFATFARLGEAIPRTYILKITDAGGKTIHKYEPKKGEQVIRPDTAYILNDMASDPNASYLPSGFYKWHRYNGWNFAIKTGTTNDSFDGLMASWSTKYAVVSWVGHHTRQKALGGFMELMTTPMNRAFMTKAHDLAGPAVNWQRPAGVKEDRAFVITSHVGIGSVEPSRGTDLYPSWYKSPTGSSTTNAKIDKVSGKLSTECTPQRAIQDSAGSNSNIFSVDIFVDKKTANTTAQDDVHSCSDAKPTITLVSNNVACAGSCNISATVNQGTHPLSGGKFPGTVNLIIDGAVVASTTVGSPGVVNLSYSPNFTGVKSFRLEVVDSVLYDASDSGSITGSGGSSPLTITDPTTGEDVGGPGTATTSMSWSGGIAGYTVSVNAVPQPQCTGISTSCNINVPGGNGTNYTAIVTDSTGATASVNFKK